MEWTSWCNESTFDGPDSTSRLSVVGVVALYIACLVRDVEFPEGIDEDDQTFMQEVWYLAPKTARGL